MKLTRVEWTLMAVVAVILAVLAAMTSITNTNFWGNPTEGQKANCQAQYQQAMTDAGSNRAAFYYYGDEDGYVQQCLANRP